MLLLLSVAPPGNIKSLPERGKSLKGEQIGTLNADIAVVNSLVFDRKNGSELTTMPFGEGVSVLNLVTSERKSASLLLIGRSGGGGCGSKNLKRLLLLLMEGHSSHSSCVMSEL